MTGPLWRCRCWWARDFPFSRSEDSGEGEETDDGEVEDRLRQHQEEKMGMRVRLRRERGSQSETTEEGRLIYYHSFKDENDKKNQCMARGMNE